MHVTFRRLGAACAAVAISATLATTADAATTTVKLHTQADNTKFLSDPLFGLAEMRKANAGDQTQHWRRSDTTAGYARYQNVGTTRCLTGRGIAGFPVVTVETCVAGALNQQWRLGVSGDLWLRLNGLVAMHKLLGNGSAVVMSQFQHEHEQKWHTHPA